MYMYMYVYMYMYTSPTYSYNAFSFSSFRIIHFTVHSTLCQSFTPSTPVTTFASPLFLYLPITLHVHVHVHVHVPPLLPSSLSCPPFTFITSATNLLPSYPTSLPPSLLPSLPLSLPSGCSDSSVPHGVQQSSDCHGRTGTCWYVEEKRHLTPPSSDTLPVQIHSGDDV